jgi:hypothetical protein
MEVSGGGGPVSAGGAESKGAIVVSMLVSTLPVSTGTYGITSDVASLTVPKSEHVEQSPL